jgi:hypothetical protein
MKFIYLLQIQFPHTLIKYKRPKILLRLDTKLTKEEIKNYVDLSRKSGIIYGFFVDGMITQVGN